MTSSYSHLIGKTYAASSLTPILHLNGIVYCLSSFGKIISRKPFNLQDLTDIWPLIDPDSMPKMKLQELTEGELVQLVGLLYDLGKMKGNC
jgi:hypothetical protein